VELLFLRSALRARLGVDRRIGGVIVKLWACAALAALAAWGVKLLVDTMHPWVIAVLVLGTFGVIYLATTAAVGIEQARTLLARAARTR
jgi:hypothetical protein